jgi:serralysin
MPADTSGFTKFNAQQIAQTQLSLQSWSDVANITFVRVNATGYSNDAQILFADYSAGMEGAAAFAYYPGQYYPEDGDIWVNGTYDYNTNPSSLNYGRYALTHEIGHAIGLAHPGNYNGDAGSPTYETSATYYEDTRQYSVMSYWSETNTGADFFGLYAAAPLLDDIAAAQRLYGANVNTRMGDTVYGFNSNSGRDFYSATSASSKLIFAVWDAGGVDTLNFSGYSDAQVIDLREGSFSNVGGLVGNVAIARGAVVENALGGSGADTIIGNAAANTLRGYDGNDILYGLDGNDTLYGGYNSDTLYGGLGNDTYIVSDASDLTIEDLTAGGTDTVLSYVSSWILAANLENLTLSGASAVNGTGNALNNTLLGNASANTLNGMSGGDTLKGGLGNDTYVVDNSGDLIVEASSSGTDIVKASLSYALASNVENLTLTGSASINGTGNDLANTILGNAAANTLVGLGGNDTLNGGAGADTLHGGTGNDNYLVDNVGDLIVEASASGTELVSASVSYTLATNVEKLTLTGSAAINGTGNALGNTLTGNGAANVLKGAGGIDTLNGGAGGDTLYGGTGNDTLNGGTGADKFMFDAALGATTNVDRISDFSIIDDTIGLDMSYFTKLTGTGALAASAFYQGTGAHDADDRIIYDSAAGKLYYDADGTGVEAPVLFGLLGTGLALTSADFLVLA